MIALGTGGVGATHRAIHGLLLCVACLVPPALAAQTTDVAASDSTLFLEPGDVVLTKVWQERTLSDTSKVDESGRLTLPMLGVVPVLHRPWSRLRDSLIAEFQLQLKNPSITLTPLRRVQVLGEVNKPGQYLADPTMNLAGLVALAGGANELGDLHRVRVVRDGVTIIRAASVESLLLQQRVHSNDQIFVDRRSWFERNTALVASTILSVSGILVTIIHR